MRPPLLYVSNFLSGELNRGYCEDLADRLELDGRRVLRTSSRLSRLARVGDMVRTTWNARRHYRLGLVDVFSGPAFLWAEAVCFELRRLRKPYVLTLHGGMLPEFGRRWPGRVARLLRSAASVTAPSEYLRSQMRAYCDDIAMIRNAIDLRTFTSSSRRGRDLIWVRAFHHIYNPTLAIDVLARCVREDPRTHLTMLGPDKGDGSLKATERRAAELGVSANVTFAGAVTKSAVPSYLANASLFLNTTNADNTPLSVLEAMAAGLPVVTTAVGGIPYLLQDRYTALLVPANDANSMARAVEQIYADELLRTKLVTNARDLAGSCSWTNVVDQWNALLDGVASG